MTRASPAFALLRSVACAQVGSSYCLRIHAAMAYQAPNVSARRPGGGQALRLELPHAAAVDLGPRFPLDDGGPFLSSVRALVKGRPLEREGAVGEGAGVRDARLPASRRSHRRTCLSSDA